MVRKSVLTLECLALIKTAHTLNIRFKVQNTWTCGQDQAVSIAHKAEAVRNDGELISQIVIIPKAMI